MASKIVVFALVLTFCKVQSQSTGCSSNYQSTPSSKGQSSYGYGQSQPQTIQFQPSSNNGVKASPQLQIVPGQNCNLQAIPLSQLLSQSQGSNLKSQTGCNVPKQNIQVTSIPQNPSSCAQCTQPQPCNCNPSVITAPASTITIPPTSCTTIIDNTLSNSLANALQMMIANDFINSAISNNIVNQDCLSIPVVETSVPAFDLSSFVKNLNAKQLQQYQGSGKSTGACYQPDDCVQTYDWEQLLGRLQDTQCSQPQPKTSDWTAVLNYLNSQNKPGPEYDYSSCYNSLKQNGKTQYPQDCNVQPYASSNQCDIESSLIEALKAYLGSSSSNTCGNVAEVMFPEEIPAELVCNYGYMPTTVPVVNFSVQPVGDSNCNFVVGPQKCY